MFKDIFEGVIRHLVSGGGVAMATVGDTTQDIIVGGIFAVLGVIASTYDKIRKSKGAK